MERTPKLCLELARVTEIDQRLSAWLESYGTGPIREPCPFLDAIELDELQFLRLPADMFRNPSRPSLRTMKRYCRVANLSESFYRCISEDQWLRTVIVSQDPVFDLNTNVTIHSNVVPTQAYLTRIEGLMATCGHQCCGGFFPANILREIEERHRDDLAMLSRRCRDCALAEELMVGAQRLGAADAPRLLSLEVGDVELVRDLGKGSEGTVSKVLWRRGTFARKRFKRHVHFQNVNFNKELDVALTVSHPNIVYFFGCSSLSSRNSGGDFELFMELLDKDLGSFIVEGARLHEGSGSSLQFQPFSFQDSLDVLLQVAEAMRHLHERNFVHGDLKPQNILIDCFALTHSDPQYYLVKVADFGCAQRTDSSGSTVEPFRCGIGTLRYTAPEVLRCRKHAGALPEHPQKIDVYSFGVVAYQVLTGVTNLYEGLRNSEITEGVIQGHLRPDFDLNTADLNEDRSLLLPIMRRCWTALPQDRPSFSEVCCEIRALLST